MERYFLAKYSYVDDQKSIIDGHYKFIAKDNLPSYERICEMICEANNLSANIVCIEILEFISKEELEIKEPK